MHVRSFLEQLLSSVYICVETVSGNAEGAFEGVVRTHRAQVHVLIFSRVSTMLEGIAVSTMEADYLYSVSPSAKLKHGAFQVIKVLVMNLFS